MLVLVRGAVLGPRSRRLRRRPAAVDMMRVRMMDRRHEGASVADREIRCQRLARTGARLPARVVRRGAAA